MRRVNFKLKQFFKIEFNANRIFGLDILRAMAILFVVVHHSQNYLPNAVYKYISIFILDGVSIFFVLSGFLIGGILIKQFQKEDITFKTLVTFWTRRWFRTLPNYFLILVLLLTLSGLFYSDFSILNYYKYFIFSQNIFSVHPRFFMEAWSLSIEEWFYLMLPILLFLFSKSKISVVKSIIFTTLIVIIGVTLLRYIRYSTMPIDNSMVWDNVFRKQVITRMDSLMFGVFGAYLYYYHGIFWHRFRIQFLVIGLLLFAVVRTHLFHFRMTDFRLYECVFSFSLESLATLCVLPFLSSIVKGQGFLFRAITYISIISYSMYLVNYTLVQHWIINYMNWTTMSHWSVTFTYVVKYILFWGLTIVISGLLYKYYERPVMNLRDYIKINR